MFLNFLGVKNLFLVFLSPQEVVHKIFETTNSYMDIKKYFRTSNRFFFYEENCELFY